MSVAGGIRLTLIIGVLLDWLGSLCNSFGNVFMRKHALQQHSKDNPEVCAGVQQMKVLALACFTGGAMSDAVSLAMIPLSTWACNTAISIPMSAVIAKTFLGEKMVPLQWFSVLIITAGSVGSVFFGSHDEKNDVLHALGNTFIHPGPLSLCIIVVVIQGITIYYTRKRVMLLKEYDLATLAEEEPSVVEKVTRSLSQSLSQTDTNLWLQFSPDPKLATPPASNQAHEPGTYKWESATTTEPLSPQSDDGSAQFPELYLSSRQKLGYLVAVSLAAALQSCWTSLLMKSTAQIFRNIFNPNNISVLAWSVIPLLGFSAFLQLTFIQYMVRCFQAVVVVPVYQCLLIIMTACFGVVFFQEYPTNYYGFYCMIFLVCLGISIIMFVPDDSGQSRFTSTLLDESVRADMNEEYDISLRQRHNMDERLLSEEYV